MPKGDGTGPDGKGPKKVNKGWPKKDGTGDGKCNHKGKCKECEGGSGN